MSESPANKTKISWIIAAFNEEGVIEKTIQATKKVVGKNVEIIVSDDGSTDSTSSVCKKIPEVKVIENKHFGFGAALISGMHHANGEIIVLSAADIIISKDDFFAIMEKIQNVDLILLSKSHPDAVIYNRGKLRSILSSLFNLSARTLFGLDYHDIQGAKVLRRKLIKPVLISCSEKGYLLTLEIVLVAKRQGFKIIEMPIKLVHRSNNAMIFRIFYFIFGLLKIWINDRNGRYDK